MKRILYSGFFDLLHVGHVRAFKKASKLGYLIVHVPPDKEARMVKGELRPVIPQDERAELVSYIKYVSAVFAPKKFLTDEEVIRATKADIIIRNEGNTESFPIQVKYLSRFIPKSKLDTTGIIKKIKSSKEPKKISGVNFIILFNEEILLQRRDQKPDIRCPGELAIPGGKIEKGENPHMACIREIQEETGIKIHGDKLDFVCDYTYPWGETSRFFIVKLNKKHKIKESEGKMIWSKKNNLKLAGGQEYVFKFL